MEIRFVSSLTPEDEERMASAFLPALTSVLDLLPIAYSIQVKTTSGKTLDRTHATPAVAEPGHVERTDRSVAHPHGGALDSLKLLLFNHPQR